MPVVVVATVVVLVMLVLLLVAELLVEVFGAAEEFASMEMPASMAGASICPAPYVRRESARRRINSC